MGIYSLLITHYSLLITHSYFYFFIPPLFSFTRTVILNFVIPLFYPNPNVTKIRVFLVVEAPGAGSFTSREKEALSTGRVGRNLSIHSPPPPAPRSLAAFTRMLNFVPFIPIHWEVITRIILAEPIMRWKSLITL